ncbi:MAG: NFACT family protein [Leptospirillia bacterium]
MAAATIRPMTGPRAMTEVEIAVAVAEIADATVDGVIMRVRQPMPDHLAISVRKAGKHHEFVVGVAAGMARIHLARNLPPTPPGPSAFTLRARKLMRPARLVAVEQVAGDRIVRIRISGHREADGRWQSSLIAELFGRGRLLLLDADDRVLAWHGPGGGRGLVVGAPYTAPPGGRPGGARGGGAGGRGALAAPTGPPV